MAKDSIMEITNAINPVYSSADNSTITCTITTDAGDTMEYTAASYDSEDYGIQLWNDLSAGKYGAITAYIAPPAPPAPPAPTLAELQAQLNTITAQIAALTPTT